MMMKVPRQHFIRLLALAGIVGSSASCSENVNRPEQRHITPTLTWHDYDHASVLAALRQAARHKQVFQYERLTLTDGVPTLFPKIQNSLNAFEFSMGVGSLITLGVLFGNATCIALSDDIWSKYQIGVVYNLKDHRGRIIRTNIFGKAKTALSLDGRPDAAGSVYRDLSAEAIRARGGRFMICYNSLANVASELAPVTGEDALDVLAQLRSSLMPGFLLVPAGVGIVQLAQENGWKLYPVL